MHCFYFVVLYLWYSVVVKFQNVMSTEQPFEKSASVNKFYLLNDLKLNFDSRFLRALCRKMFGGVTRSVLL